MFQGGSEKWSELGGVSLHFPSPSHGCPIPPEPTTRRSGSPAGGAGAVQEKTGSWLDVGADLQNQCRGGGRRRYYGVYVNSTPEGSFQGQGGVRSLFQGARSERRSSMVGGTQC